MQDRNCGCWNLRFRWRLADPCVAFVSMTCHQRIGCPVIILRVALWTNFFPWLTQSETALCRYVFQNAYLKKKVIIISQPYIAYVNMFLNRFVQTFLVVKKMILDVKRALGGSIAWKGVSGGSWNGGTPIAGWFIREKPSKIDDLGVGVPYFRNQVYSVLEETDENLTSGRSRTSIWVYPRVWCPIPSSKSIIWFPAGCWPAMVRVLSPIAG